MIIRQTPLTAADLIEELKACDPNALISSAEIALKSETRFSRFSYSHRRWIAALAESRAVAAKAVSA